MKKVYAVRYKKDHNIYMGVDYHKRGNTYFPTYLLSDDEINQDNEFISSKVCCQTDEYFNDTWNQHTLLWEMQMWSELTKDNENVFAQPTVRDTYGLFDDFVFDRDEWEVVEIKLDINVITQNY